MNWITNFVRPKLQAFVGKKEVPVWADVATNVGIELIKSGDLGTALEVGQKTAKASRAAKTQKDLMLSQLAFGVYKEENIISFLNSFIK